MKITPELYYERILPACLFVMICIGATVAYITEGFDGLAVFGITLFMVILFSVFMALAMHGGK